MTPRVPERAERLVKWSLAPWERQAVLGDLQEEFLMVADAAGAVSAERWYWRHVLFSIWPNLIRRARGDQYRATAIRRGVMPVTQGLLFMMMSTDPARAGSTGRDAYFGLGICYVIVGLLLMGSALLRQRVRSPSTGSARLMGLSLLASIVVVLALSMSSIARLPHAFVAIPIVPALFIMAASALARRSAYPPPSVFFVRRAATGEELPGTWIEMDVPNVPLALTNLVLCHGPAALAAPGVASGAPTIQRSFPRTETLRLYAIVNAPAATARAQLDIVAANGETHVLPVPIGHGDLEEVVKRWDDVADREPSVNFGTIDVRLPLADLEPGRYRLRLTVDDGERTSAQQERIDVIP